MSNNNPQSDAFIERLRAGEKTAFADLVDMTSTKIYALALRMLNNEQDAEDVLQETYLKAYRALPGFEYRSSLYTWVFRIAANEALMMLRKRKNAAPMVEVDEEKEEDDSPLEIVDWCCLPESEFLTAETKDELAKAAGQLSPVLRLVFLLRDVQGFSVSETAQILGINENVVKTRLVRARLKLRNILSSYFSERLGKETING
jgi:RNA polymerase sigma-70 factor, ECF subfamily